MDDQLPAALWIDAHLRKLNAEGRPYYIVHKGAYAAGTVMLKITAWPEGCLLMQQQRDLDGTLGWLTLFKGLTVSEPEADDHIRRAIDRDPDIWVIEVEDKEKRNPFEGKIF
jgi:hypothetical protein